MKRIGIQIKDENDNEIYPNPFPVGAIYMSVDSRNPSKIFGGTWEQIKDKFILCAGDSYAAGSTGGSKTHSHTTGNHTLTVAQIPSHTHTYFRSRAIWAEEAADSSTAIGCTNTWAYGKTYPSTYATGGNQPHNHGNTGTTSNMPPYLAVYVWRRVS